MIIITKYIHIKLIGIILISTIAKWKSEHKQYEPTAGILCVDPKWTSSLHVMMSYRGCYYLIQLLHAVCEIEYLDFI